MSSAESGWGECSVDSTVLGKGFLKKETNFSKPCIQEGISVLLNNWFKCVCYFSLQDTEPMDPKEFALDQGL